LFEKTEKGNTESCVEVILKQVYTIFFMLLAIFGAVGGKARKNANIGMKCFFFK